MAIETPPESAHAPGGREPGAAPKERSWWLRPAWHTALIGAVVGYAFGHWLRHFIAAHYQQVHHADGNDFAIVLGYAFLVVGWLVGLGVFNDLVRQMLGKPLNGNGHDENGGGAEIVRGTLPHKGV